MMIRLWSSHVDFSVRWKFLFIVRLRANAHTLLMVAKQRGGITTEVQHASVLSLLEEHL